MLEQEHNVTTTVKFFAAAAAAAGVDSMTVQVSPGATVEEVLQQVAAGNEQLGKLVPFCALLGPNGFIQDRSLPATMDSIEVLPPFAGG